MERDSWLPSEEGQKWLVARLAGLIRARGWEPFASNPILEPTDAYFPTRWTNDGSGYYWTTRRILKYAGLDDLDAVIQVFTPGSDLPDVPDSVAAWFEGIDGDRCRFGVKLGALKDAEGFVAAMAHEVAHAYRTHFHLRHVDPGEEELLTDLTTVYLGFGLLSTNASYRYRASGQQVGAYAVTQWSHSKLGYLALESMTFLLSLQMVVRGGSKTELGRVRRHLEITQRAAFDEGMKEIGPMSDVLRKSFGVPDRSEWPKDPEAAPALEPLEGSPQVILHEPKPRILPNSGNPVFRVKVTSSINFAWLGLGIGFVVFGLWIAHGSGLLPAVVALVITIAVLTILGRRRVRDVCSEPNCESVIPPDAEICPGCGGTVSGRIRHPYDRRAAVEALRDRRSNRKPT